MDLCVFIENRGSVVIRLVLSVSFCRFGMFFSRGRFVSGICNKNQNFARELRRFHTKHQKTKQQPTWPNWCRYVPPLVPRLPLATTNMFIVDQPKTLPSRVDGKTRHRKAQMGNGIPRPIEFRGQLHECEAHQHRRMERRKEWRNLGWSVYTVRDIIPSPQSWMGADCRCNNVLWVSENAPYDSDRMQQD